MDKSELERIIGDQKDALKGKTIAIMHDMDGLDEILRAAGAKIPLHFNFDFPKHQLSSVFLSSWGETAVRWTYDAIFGTWDGLTTPQGPRRKIDLAILVWANPVEDKPGHVNPNIVRDYSEYIRKTLVNLRIREKDPRYVPLVVLADERIDDVELVKGVGSAPGVMALDYLDPMRSPEEAFLFDKGKFASRLYDKQAARDLLEELKKIQKDGFKLAQEYASKEVQRSRQVRFPEGIFHSCPLGFRVPGTNQVWCAEVQSEKLRKYDPIAYKAIKDYLNGPHVSCPYRDRDDRNCVHILTKNATK
ncbi:MAG: hypothetical protein ABIE94_02380 [archaeon]